MRNVGYYDGQVGLIEEMRVPMNDRACYFGDGVYDATYAKEGVPFLLEDHIDRFYGSANALEIAFDMPKEALKALILDLIAKVDDPDAMVYWQLTRGTAMRGHAFPKEAKSNLWVLIYPKAMHALSDRLHLITVPDTRYLHCNVKTLNLVPNVMAAQRAAEAKCEEVAFHRDGVVTEGSHSNLHILKDGALRTAPLSRYILPGITRKHLLRLARANGIPVCEEAFTVEEMMAADEVLVTSAGTLCCAVDTIDGKPVGGRAPELLAALQGAYEKELKEAIANAKGSI
ncbi:MAG TPA: aminotransferase class IV [Clostridia bacterium]|nr:aminotransferase class IV [Clostridia bacterium]